ncbi:MAG: hypothetical protein R3231_08295 [bacterium]|nr:hypothetical protein [bacterium]
MKYRRTPRPRWGLKIVTALVVAAIGLALIEFVEMKGGWQGIDDPTSQAPLLNNDNKKGYVKMTKIHTVSDLSTGPTATSDSPVMRSATFALG